MVGWLLCYPGCAHMSTGTALSIRDWDGYVLIDGRWRVLSLIIIADFRYLSACSSSSLVMMMMPSFRGLLG